MKSRVVPLILLLISMLSIQWGASLAKSSFAQMEPSLLSALRVGISALILFIGARAWRQIPKSSEWFWIAQYGFALGLMNLMFYYSLRTIPLGVAVTLEFIGPLGIALLHSKKRKDILWVFLAALGLYLLMPLHQQARHLDLVGCLWALGAGFFWALYIQFGKKISQFQFESTALTGWGMMFAAAIVVPVGLYQNGAEVLDPKYLKVGVSLALLSSAIPYALEMKVLNRLSKKTFGILMSLEPVVATLMGIAVLQESLQPSQCFAIACIVVASIGVIL